MSPLRLRAGLRRVRRRTALVTVLVILVGAVAVHHAAPMDMHMGGAVMCLAILGLAGAALAAVRDVQVLPRLLAVRLVSRLSLVEPAPRSVPARAGPIRLQVLRL